MLARTVGLRATAIHAPVAQAIGVAMLAAGIGVSVWARINLGRNWGMPMTQKDEPELVTSGPYRFIRHPIYSGLLLAGLGTAAATNLLWLLVVAALTPYFVYSARVEERLMDASFPRAYPSYRRRMKMFIRHVI